MKKLIILLMYFIFISCSQKEGCMDSSACNFDDKAENDNSSCTYSEEYYDCDSNCLFDENLNGICDELEILGCTDLNACNYNENATEDDGLCSYPEPNYDCDGNCLSYNYECGDCEYTFFTEVPHSINILSGNNCFKNQDLDVINQIISLNNLDYNSPLEVGTQTWYDGRLRIWIAGNYFSGVNVPLDTLPENFGNLDDLRSLYLEWNNIKVMPESFENLTNLISLYFSNNGLTNIINNIGNLTELYNLDLGYNEIKTIPNSFAELTNLQYLWLFNNQIETLPNGFCNLNINWSEMDPAWYPYFAIGGNELCENIPECILNSSHFESSLDQFYYSFLVEMPQNCED
tara:strand:+ start:1400 stop:2437 length:1038 start_codon:yes stop_codon:yes gene_type:complete